VRLAGLGAECVWCRRQPDVVSNVAIFLAVANTLGLAALVCNLLSWSRSSIWQQVDHRDGHSGYRSQLDRESAAA
jgi:hypothetical protein